MTCRPLRRSRRKPRPASRRGLIVEDRPRGADRQSLEHPWPETLSALVEQALADVDASRDLAALDEVRVRVLGKKGLLTEQLKSLGKLPGGRASRGGPEDQRRQERDPERPWRRAASALERGRLERRARARAPSM